MVPALFTVRKSAHFKTAMNAGKKWITKSFVVIAAPLSVVEAFKEIDGTPIAMGVVASKKVGNAVCRNRAKRRLRALLRDNLPTLGQPEYIYLFIARKEILSYDFDQMQKDLKWSLKKLAVS